MTAQTLVIGKRRFVVVPEADFLRLQKEAGEGRVRKEVGEDGARALRAYQRTGKAADWKDVKKKLGL